MNKKSILFVCTGNTCRSPMAMALLRTHLYQLGCYDITVDSAASLKEHEGKLLAGRPVSDGTSNVLIANGRHEFLEGHRSKHVGDIELDSFDEIHCMAEENARTVRELAPNADIRVLLYDQGGVPNPFKKGQEAYNDCYAVLDPVMEEMARRLVTES